MVLEAAVAVAVAVASAAVGQRPITATNRVQVARSVSVPGTWTALETIFTAMIPAIPRPTVPTTVEVAAAVEAAPAPALAQDRDLDPVQAWDLA
jgi:hypothetical protein